MKKYRVGLVSYLNSKPFLEGIIQSQLLQTIHLHVLPPAAIAQMLTSNEIDIGLVPVKVMQQLSTPMINTNFCISCDGPVHTVCIFSSEPLNTCHTLLLDNESRTSVALAKLLIKDHFGTSITFKPAYEGYEYELKNGTAGLVIGDRAFPLHSKYEYVYDLGLLWKQHTGLPFVFAAWVSNAALDETFLMEFDNALRYGVDVFRNHLDVYATQYPGVNVKEYFERYIQLTLDDKKRKAIALFLERSKSNL